MAALRRLIRAARSELRSGRWEPARGLFWQALQVSPGNVQAAHGYGIATLRSGAVDDAVAWLRRSLRDHPDSAELQHALAQGLMRAGRFHEACGLLEAAHGKRPTDTALLKDLQRARQGQASVRASNPAEHGARLLANGRIEEAVVELRAAAEQHPDAPQVFETLGHACLQDGRVDHALEAFRSAIRLRPHAHVYAYLADAHSAAGDSVKAEEAIRQAIRLQPGYGQGWLRLAHIKKFESDSDSDVHQLLRIVAGGNVPAVDEEPMRFALGKIYDDLARADDAFAHLQRANELHKVRSPFDMGAMLGLIDRIEQVCDASFFDRFRTLGVSSEIPVFIVGVPRCGSTLVEQIIASHPRAYGVGELRLLARLVADLPARLAGRAPFPECLLELNDETAGAMTQQYLQRLTRDSPPEVLRVCDKMLSHLLLLGMLGVMFPRALVLYCKRDLMDAGLSMYMQSFGGTGVGYAYDLEHIGQYHQRCEALMRHWKRRCPARIVEVQYEQLVRSPEQGVRELLDAVGLSWDARCLASHQGARQVRTVSDWQVRRPIHRRSVERWRAYERHLAPLRRYVSDQP
ncbi:MAG: sulfotransferase [Polyangiaceae bacterium]|jgi:Flp pilus assembly protein TadD|nr:sulfotransferase [Polyangiaceae bacterium]